MEVVGVIITVASWIVLGTVAAYLYFRLVRFPERHDKKEDDE